MYLLKTKFFNDIIEQSYYKQPFFNNISHNSSSISSLSSYQSKLSHCSSRLKEIVLCNSFDYFLTLTLKDDLRFKKNEAIRCIDNFISRYRKRAKRRGFDFRYVYVYELTKNGGIHCHGFFSGFYDLYTNKYNHLSSFFFDDLGFQCFIPSSSVNVNYLIKYIKKDPVYIKHLYKCSKGLNKPFIDIYHDRFDNFLDFPFTFKNQYCKMITYKVDSNL